MNQLSLFTTTKDTNSKYKRIEELGDWEAMREYAFLFTVGEKFKGGSCNLIRFMMTTEDARKFCSSPKSKGTLHGNRWAYFFTTVYSFFASWYLTYYRDGNIPIQNYKPLEIDITKLVDNGSYDSKIEECGATKIPFSQFAFYLEPMGIKVIDRKKTI